MLNGKEASRPRLKIIARWSICQVKSTKIIYVLITNMFVILTFWLLVPTIDLTYECTFFV